MSEVNRITAEEIKTGVDAGSVLLVCAYDDDAKFKFYHLQGAIPLSEFKLRLPDLSKGTNLVFYCA